MHIFLQKFVAIQPRASRQNGADTNSIPSPLDNKPSFLEQLVLPRVTFIAESDRQHLSGAMVGTKTCVPSTGTCSQVGKVAARPSRTSKKQLHPRN